MSNHYDPTHPHSNEALYACAEDGCDYLLPNGLRERSIELLWAVGFGPIAGYDRVPNYESIMAEMPDAMAALERAVAWRVRDLP